MQKAPHINYLLLQWLCETWQWNIGVEWRKQLQLLYIFLSVIAMLNPFQWLIQTLRASPEINSRDDQRPRWPQNHNGGPAALGTWAGWDLTGGSRLRQSLVASRLHTEETHPDKCRLDSGLRLIQYEDDCPRQRWTGLGCFKLKRPEKTKARLVQVNLAITADVVGH